VPHAGVEIWQISQFDKIRSNLNASCSSTFYKMKDRSDNPVDCEDDSLVY